MSFAGIDRRYSPRVQAQLPIMLRIGADEVRSETVEISFGGVFVATTATPALRQLVQLSIELPHGTRLEIDGMVVRIVNEADARKLATVPGIGVQFYGLGEIVEDIWRAYIDDQLRDLPSPIIDDQAVEDEESGRSTLVEVGRDDQLYPDDETTATEEPSERSVEDIARDAGLDPRIVAAALALANDPSIGERVEERVPIEEPLSDFFDSEGSGMEIDVLHAPPLVLIDPEEERRERSAKAKAATTAAQSSIAKPIRIIGPESSPASAVTAQQAPSPPPPPAEETSVGSDETEEEEGRSAIIEPVPVERFNVEGEGEAAVSPEQPLVVRQAGIPRQKQTLRLAPDEIARFNEEDRRAAEAKRAQAIVPVQAVLAPRPQDSERSPAQPSERLPEPAKQPPPWAQAQSPNEPLAAPPALLDRRPAERPAPRPIAEQPSGPLAPTGALPHVVFKLPLPTVEALEDFNRKALVSGGVYIRTEDVKPAGTPAVVCVVHPVSGDEFHIPGVVASARFDDRPRVGIKFAGISQLAMKEFRRFIAAGARGSDSVWSDSGEGSGLAMVSSAERSRSRESSGGISKDTHPVDVSSIEPFIKRD